jgi:RNA polymerase sigma-70 factor (ECF subfamily)
MTGNHPKRRKDKSNPYSICERNGKYYISFRDGQAVLHELEISKVLYDTFNRFELDDLSYFNELDRHLEQSEVWENTLFVRAFYRPESVEEVVLRNIERSELHRAIQTLTETQRRRLVFYYFEGMTYDQIARVEGCSKVAVKYTVDKAVEKLKKILK